MGIGSNSGPTSRSYHRIRPEDLLFVIALLVVFISLAIWNLPVPIGSEFVQHLFIGILILVAVTLFEAFKPILKGGIKEKHSAFIRFMRGLRDWSPLLFAVLVYELISDLVYTVRPGLADQELMRMDELLFGGQPTIFMERLTAPLLTDMMTFVYMLYFILPAVPMMALYWADRRREFRNVLMALVISLYLAYIGYILVPTVGPRYFISESYSFDLKGIILYEGVTDFWTVMESLNRDCFPSHHTAIAAISTYAAYLCRKRFSWGGLLLWTYVLLTLATIFSTIYLRYHWVVDIYAGLLVAFLSVCWASWINGFWYRKSRGAK